MNDLQTGPDKVIGSYLLLEQLGHGTYGQVFSGKHVKTGKKFAIKKILYNVTQEFIFLHFREISILKSLKHASIIEISDVVVPSSLDSDCIYIVFPLYDSDLRMYVKTHFKDRKVPLGILKDLFVQIVSGISYCHKRKILHRDIKPPNVLVDWKSLKIKICDFGLAKSFIHRTFSNEEGVALTHEIVTLWYRAPEVLLGCQYYDYKIDVWSLGVLLLEMLWGMCPFNGRTEIETLMKIFNLVGTPNRENCPGCTEWEFWSEEYPIWKPEKALSRIKKRDLSSESSEEFLELAESMLRINPKNRIDCEDVLRHESLMN